LGAGAFANAAAVFIEGDVAHPGKIFMRLVQQAMKSTKITYSETTWDINQISEYYAT
jgi:hypothetical protein